MRCLGLIGSTPATTEIYWSTIRRECLKALGPREHPRLLIHSAKTESLLACVRTQDWDALTEALASIGSTLHDAGAEGLIVCGSALNTTTSRLRPLIGIPVLEVGQALAAQLRESKVERVGILGIRSPAEESMWRTQLPGMSVYLPRSADGIRILQWIDQVGEGVLPSVEWKIQTNRMIAGLKREGAQVVLLADAAAQLWVTPGETPIYPLNSAEIHAWMAARWALGQSHLSGTGRLGTDLIPAPSVHRPHQQAG